MMIAFAWLIAQALTTPLPSPACVGPDIAIANVRYTTFRGNASSPDRIVVAAHVINVGTAAQTPGIAQHVELLHDGRVVVSEPVRALRTGERYLVALRIFRPIADRKDPLDVIVRYVADDRRARGENCATANDSLQKIF